MVYVPLHLKNANTTVQEKLESPRAQTRQSTWQLAHPLPFDGQRHLGKRTLTPATGDTWLAVKTRLLPGRSVLEVARYARVPSEARLSRVYLVDMPQHE